MMDKRNLYNALTGYWSEFDEEDLEYLRDLISRDQKGFENYPPPSPQSEKLERSEKYSHEVKRILMEELSNFPTTPRRMPPGAH